MLKNFTSEDINKEKSLKSNFLNAEYKSLGFNCNILKGNFYLDSYNYFVIDKEFRTFADLFSRDKYQKNEHFFSEKFYKNFKSKIDNFKQFENIFILGSNAANNYYSNLLQFLPRIFFINKSKIKIAIHRNSSTKFREFIKLILEEKNINFSFIYLDDGFYKFTNCEIPQFLNLNKSITILKNLLIPNNQETDDKKIYVTREDSAYRKVVNEADIIPILRSKGYKVINPYLYTINEQIKIFSGANKIIAPHGSNLSNIIFCKPGTQIYEIGPKFTNSFEKIFENRYKNLAEIRGLSYIRLIADSVTVDSHSDLALKYINSKILDESNYYKNLIVKVTQLSSLI